MVLCRNGDGCGEARDEADCVSESGRIDAMAPGPLAGCDATSMILNWAAVVGGTRVRALAVGSDKNPILVLVQHSYTKEMGSKRGTKSKQEGRPPESNTHDTSLNAGGRLKLPMNRID